MTMPSFTKSPPELVARFEAAGELPGGEGRFGLLTRGRAWELQASRAGFAALATEGGPAVRELDVTKLGVALDALTGIDDRGIQLVTKAILHASGHRPPAGFHDHL